MYLFVGDETNREASRDAIFFVYGGIFLPIQELPALTKKIHEIRCEAGYTAKDELKADSHSRPSQVTNGRFIAAKEQVIDACIEHKCRFIVNITPHELIKNQNAEKYVPMAANMVVGGFNLFLRQETTEHGICVIDRFEDRSMFAYLKEKSQYGLCLPNRTVALDRIDLFCATVSGAGHINSAADIILGSFRYAINNPRNRNAASKMIKKVFSLIWKDAGGQPIKLGNKGLLYRPKYENLGSLKKLFDDLIIHINSLVREA
jgi:hypothetical protein